MSVGIGAFPITHNLPGSRIVLQAVCQETYHPKTKCDAAHEGGTHSLGPLFSTPINRPGTFTARTEKWTRVAK